MATLLLTHSASDAIQHTLRSPSLRAWLGEDWAILFSHPNDFVSYDLEMDRWVVITRRAFADRHVRPIALAARGGGEAAHGWVTQVSGDERTVLLQDPKREHFGPVDLQAPVLREAIEQSGGRFVMIIDNALRVHKKLAYESLSDLPSPLELLGWADALRAKQIARQTANEESSRRVPPELSRELAVRQAHPFFAPRRHKHPIPRVACAPVPHARAV